MYEAMYAFIDWSRSKVGRIIEMAIAGVFVVLGLVVFTLSFNRRDANEQLIAENQQVLAKDQYELNTWNSKIDTYKNSTATLGSVYSGALFKGRALADLQNAYNRGSDNADPETIQSYFRDDSAIYSGPWFPVNHGGYTWSYIIEMNSLKADSPALWNCRDRQGNLLAIAQARFDGTEGIEKFYGLTVTMTQYGRNFYEKDLQESGGTSMFTTITQSTDVTGTGMSSSSSVSSDLVRVVDYSESYVNDNFGPDTVLGMNPSDWVSDEHSGGKLNDGTIKSWWQTVENENGGGSVIHVNLFGDNNIDAITLFNGCPASDADYNNFSRICDMTIIVNGTEYPVKIGDHYGWSLIECTGLPACNSFDIRIDTVYEGDQYLDLCIGEICVWHKEKKTDFMNM